MNEKIITVIKFAIGWPFSIIALFFIGKIISPHISELVANVTRINLFFLLISISCFCIYYFLRSLFWNILLGMKGYSIPFSESSYLWSTSEIKRFIPGNIWSILGRTHTFTQKKIPKKTIIQALIIEAECMLLGSIILSFLAFPFILNHILMLTSNTNVLFFVIPLGVIVLITGFLTSSFIKKIVPFPFIHYFLPSVSFWEHTFLLSLACVYSFLFGIGTYFCIHSLFFLSPLFLNIFIGFFIFSFFVGYISLITPMGLGIRETVMTMGLSQFLPLHTAGFASLFARIILIVSELIFLIVSFFWQKTSFVWLRKKEQWIKIHWPEILLGIFILLYFAYFSAASLYRYTNFYTGRFDLGNMDQTVWNTIHGRIFELTNPDGTNIISRLSFHADFILVLLAPFYLVWQDPRTLLLIQTGVLCIGGLYIFLLAKKILQKRTLALLFALMYLLNPSVQDSNLFDFHAVTLATTFFLAGYYYLMNKAVMRSIIFFFLAAITKEQVWVVTAFLGIYMCFFPKVKKRKFFIAGKQLYIGMSVFCISLILFIGIFFYAIPKIHGGNHFALTYYSDFGSSPTGIIKGMIFTPQKTFDTMFAPDRLEYLKELLLPFGFLPLLAPLYLIFTLPDLAINLLSSNPAFHQIYYQYTAVITPFLFIATIYAVKRIRSHFSKLSFFIIFSYLCIATGISSYLYGPLPGERFPNVDMFIKPQPYGNVIDDFLKDIPQKYSIAATNNLGSHLSHRQKIFTIPTGIDQADIILFLLNDKFAAPSLAAQIQLANNMKQDKKYIEIMKAGDFVVFEKRNLYSIPELSNDKIKLFPDSIPTLESRDFIGGTVQIVKKIAEKKEYTSYIISYPSDGLTLFALMDIPNQPRPMFGFPVVILDHGYTKPSLYDSEKSYQYVEDYFALHGYLVIKPDYRGNGKSEIDTSLSMLLSYPIDVLNLLSSLHSIPQASQTNIFLWGHSVGAEVTLTTLIANNKNPDFPVKVKGAVVWAPVIDPYRAYQQLQNIYPKNQVPYRRAVKTIGTIDKNPLLWQSVTPLFYIDDLTTPIEIVQGTNDAVIPYTWSLELYNDLISSNKTAYLKIYPNDDHILSTSRMDALDKNLVFFQSLQTR